MSGQEIRTETGPDGEVLHLVPFGPPKLPAVSRRHLEQAWDAARGAAGRGGPARSRGFRFHGGGTPVDLVLGDRDAACWAGGVERVADLSTAYGVSLCLRLLGLVQVMGDAEWARPWFSVSRGSGAKIHPALLRAAASAPLTATGGFAESSLRALLPTH